MTCLCCSDSSPSFLRTTAVFLGKVVGAGRTMKYPYSVSGKLALFPYRWHWKNGRFVRFLGFTLVGLFPIIVKIHSAVHAPGNVRQWEEIRKKREHTHFDPVH